MCIIIYKPKGSDMVGKKTLRTCFENNPHGAGYMLSDGGLVRWEKGFMDFDSLMESLKKEGNLKDRNVVIHFRITTQGGVQKGLCHPFPVCGSFASMRELEGYAEHAVAHNGIIPSCSSSMAKDHNDTMEWVRRFADPIMGLCPRWRDDEIAHRLLEDVSEGNKFAIMDGDGSVTLIGRFIYDKARKCWFSNDSYIPYKPTVGHANSWGKLSRYGDGFGSFDPFDFGNEDFGY